MKTLSRIFVAILLCFALSSLTACGGGDGKAATEKCSKDEAAKGDGDACKKCCNDNGSQTHMWMSSKGGSCKCHVGS